MKTNLYFLFNQFGKILDIIMMKKNKMRGQAFIIFENYKNCENAKLSLENFKIFGKNMKIEFAQKKSFATKIQNSEFIYKDYKNLKKQNYLYKNKENEKLNENSEIEKTENLENSEIVKIEKSEKIEKNWNNILLVNNFPENANEELLKYIFKQYPGYKSAKLLEDQNGMGFVEFYSPIQASIALKALDGFKISEDNFLSVIYAKKI